MTVAQSISVRFFAAAADAAGREQRTVVVGPGATVAVLKEVLVELYGEEMARVLANGSVLMAGVLVRDETTAVGPEVDILPPFSGG